jgi:hypothetical protein
MRLEKDVVPNSDIVKTMFLEKYKYYCRGLDRRRDEC